MKADFRHVQHRATFSLDSRNTVCRHHGEELSPAKFPGIGRELPVKFRSGSGILPQNGKHKKLVKKPQKTLDPFSGEMPSGGQKAKQARDRVQRSRSEKQRRGRPQTMPLSWVTGRAYNARIQLQQVWSKLSGPL